MLMTGRSHARRDRVPEDAEGLGSHDRVPDQVSKKQLDELFIQVRPDLLVK